MPRGELKLCLTSQILAEFFSIVTNAKRVSDPRTPDEAADAIEAILAIPGVILLPVAPEVPTTAYTVPWPARGPAVALVYAPLPPSRPSPPSIFIAAVSVREVP